MKNVRNNLTQLQVLTLKSGEMLSLPPRASAQIADCEISADIEIKVAQRLIAVSNVPAVVASNTDDDVAN